MATAAIVYVLPFLWMLLASLMTPSELAASDFSWPRNPGWTNYVTAWRSMGFAVYMRNSIVVAGASTVIVVATASAAGYALARSDFPGRRVLLMAIVASLFLPRGYTILPTFELVKTIGLLNTLAAVILVEAGTHLAMGTLLFAGYFLTIPKDLVDAPRLDGATLPTIYLQIGLPLARPMVGAVAIFQFVESWNSFFVPLVFTLGRPDLRTLSVGMYMFVGQTYTNWPLLAAAAIMSLAPTLLVFLLLQRTFVAGVAGAIRG